MSISLVQSAVNTNHNTLAFPSNNTAGNLLICVIDNEDTYDQVPVDTQGNTWNLACTSSVDGTAVILFYAMNCAGGANTVEFTGSDDPNTISIYEFSGLKTTGALDKAAGGYGSSVSITTTASGELVFSSMDNYADNPTYPTISVGSGWTAGKNAEVNIEGFDVTIQDGWQVQSSSGSISNSSWSVSNGKGVWNGMVIASFFHA